MRQILQDMRSGKVSVFDVPAPAVQRGRVLVRTSASLISAGTERDAVEMGKKSLLGRAKQRPDLVKKVIERAKTEGILNTFTAVKDKLAEKTALGYSAAGVVTAMGEGVAGISVGMRVACAGTGYASHAEVISVPQNLCVPLPDEVSFDEGAFGTLGAIALQGVRLAGPTLGEAVVVIGLGLLGQITVQLLKANGCRVFGVDLDKDKLKLAIELGAEKCSTPSEAAALVEDWSRGRGADAVLITAATTSNDPIELAGEVSRLKGRVVAVGLVGMDVPRNVYFRKELSLQVSMSYGPGRYDAEYEERGHDYPYAYVRWTEGRNVEAFLDLIANKSISVEKLISHRFSIDKGGDAYKLISGETNEPYLGIVLQYERGGEIAPTIAMRPARTGTAQVKVGFIGAGAYAKKFLLPNFKANGAEFCSIATGSGVTANDVARQYDFAAACSTGDDVIADPSANLIVIATRHDTHATLAQQALERGKHVFVEKPLALNDEELDGIIEAARAAGGSLMVGYNRRFSPAAILASEFFDGRQFPLSIIYRVNAGRVPRDSWIQDPAQGGRIIGEVCHFIDLMHFLTGSLTTHVFAQSIVSRSTAVTDEDSVLVTLKFADGSNGTIAYLAEGDKALGKERIEIFGGGKTFVIEDFRQTTAFTNGRETVKRTKTEDKGQAEQIRMVCSVVKDGRDAPITLEDLATTSRATFRIRDSIRTGEVSKIDSGLL